MEYPNVIAAVKADRNAKWDLARALLKDVGPDDRLEFVQNSVRQNPQGDRRRIQPCVSDAHA